MSEANINQLIYGYIAPTITFKNYLIDYPTSINNNSSNSSFINASTNSSSDLLTFLDQQQYIPWCWVVALAWRFPAKNIKPVLAILYRHYAKSRINRLFNKGRFALWSIPNDRYVWYSENRYNANEDEVCDMLDSFDVIKDEVDLCLTEDQFFVDKYLQMASILWTFYRLPAAANFYQALINARPTDADNYYYLAQIAMHNNDPASALDYYKKFIEFAPATLPNNHYQLNEWFYYLRTYPPNTVDALVQIGSIYYKNYYKHDHKHDYDIVSLSPLSRQKIA